MSLAFNFSDDLLKKFGKKFPPESLLAKEGDFGDTMFIINSGRVAVVKDTPVGEKILATLFSGDFFGEMALMGVQNNRAASVRTLTETSVLELNRDAFEGLIRRSPEVAMEVLETLATRVRDANGRVAALVHKEDHIRVFAYFQHLAKEQGHKAPEPHKGSIFPVKIPEVASALDVKEADIEKLIQLSNKARILSQNGEWIWAPFPEYLLPFVRFLKKEKMI